MFIIELGTVWVHLYVNSIPKVRFRKCSELFYHSFDDFSTANPLRHGFMQQTVGSD